MEEQVSDEGQGGREDSSYGELLNGKEFGGAVTYALEKELVELGWGWVGSSRDELVFGRREGIGRVWLGLG